MIKFVRGELFKQPVSVQTRLPRGLPLVQGDELQLQHVVPNLILNAIEAVTSTDNDVRELWSARNRARRRPCSSQ